MRGQTQDLATADGHDRHVPSGATDILSAGHEGVYKWAAANLVADGTRFLDLGCGTGYGSTFVVDAGGSYDGADGSAAAIDYALARYGGEHARFVVADLMEPLPAEFAGSSYDVVFSSEVLEHVEDPFALVRTMARSLRDDGTCFVGTPNRLWSRDHMPGAGLLARSHVMEFTPPALAALLRTAFDEVRLLFRMLPADAIDAIPLPTGRGSLVRGALAFAREVAPAGLDRLRAGITGRRSGRAWSAEDIDWLAPDDPRLDPARCVGLAATCTRPKR